MSQKSSKKLSTLSKRMANETKLQLNQNTITNRLIIPVLSIINLVNGELYVDSTTNHLLFIKIMHGYKLYKFYYLHNFHNIASPRVAVMCETICSGVIAGQVTISC